MDERRRLLERVYSRQGGAEPRRDYRDPDTGETMRMTPSEWALAEYDRRHPAEDAHRLETDGVEGSASPVAERGLDASIDASADAPAGAHPTGHVTQKRDRDRRDILRVALIGVAAFVVGVLVTVGISQATGGNALPGAARSASVDPTSEPPRTHAGPAIEAFFRETPRVDNLPSTVTAGFRESTFHPIADTVTALSNSDIYAAQREDGAYCLVAVVAAHRAAETCATVQGISERGLLLMTDAVRALDGRSITIAVTWQRDGVPSWSMDQPVF